MENNERSHTMATFAVASLSTAGLAYLLLRILRRKKSSSPPTLTDKEGRKLGRAMSFTSASMALGAFPEEKNVCEHIINACIFYEPQDCPEKHDMLEIVKTFLQYERCAGIPVETRKNEWRCRECKNVDPKKLIRFIEMEGDEAATYQMISDHMQDTLVEGRGDLPWWEFLIIKNKGPGMSACVLRMHHSLADGLSIVAMLEHFVTYTDGSSMHGLIPKSMSEKFEVREGKFKFFFRLLKAALKVITQPQSRFDDKTAFSKGIGKNMVHTGKRSFVVFNSVPIDFVKELKNAAGVTLNDVLFTCLSQAIHDYCVEHDCPVLKAKGEKLQSRALVPVGFPRPRSETNDRSQTLRNKWCFVSSDMGVGIEDILDRLKFVHTHLKSIKNSPLAYVQLTIQETIPPLLPLSAARQTVFDTFCRHNLVFSNVPGPQQQCAFAGKPAIGTQMFYNNLIPQVGLISYRGQIFGNIVLDPEAIPDSDSLRVLYSRAFVNLAERLEVDIPKSVYKQAKIET